MAHDKITVDEPLISTDVDSLIRTLAERKRIPLNDLRQLCRIDKKTMDKWIAVLEDEGYISVEYGIRGTNVVWRGLDVVQAEPVSRERAEPEAAAPAEAAQEPAPEEAAPAEPEAAPWDSGEAPAEPEAASDEASGERNQEFTVEEPLEDEPEPEDLLSAYLAKRRGEGQEDSEDLKSNILTSLNGDGKPDDSAEAEPSGGPGEPSDDGKKESAADDEPFVIPAEVDKAEDAAQDAESAPPETPAPAKPAPFSRETLKPQKERAADMRELMGSYLEEINKEKSRIEELKKEREALYRDKFVTMEGKMQADIVVLTEKIIEKESRIAELKERVLELPDKVEELGRLQQQMDSLKAEGREALQRTSSRAEEYLAGIREAKSAVEGRISQVDSVLEAQLGKVRELEKLSASAEGRAEKLKAALEAARAQMGELESAMSTLGGELDSMEKARAEASALTDSVKQEVAERGAELESLEQELSGIERVEHWVQEYIRDYEQKIEDIEHYVSRSEDEYAELKEAAEGLYLKKYLGELESITDSYQSELSDAVSREKEIEMRMAESRARITDLVSESQEMIKKLKSDAPEATEKDFGVLVAKVKARTARTKNAVQEKQKERSRLAEDSRKTRKTAKPKAPKGRAPARKAAAKSVAKKRK